MATAGDLLVSASTAADGSTAGTHLLAIESASRLLGGRLSSDIESASSNLNTTLSSDALTMTATMNTNTATAETNTLTSSLCL